LTGNNHPIRIALGLDGNAFSFYCENTYRDMTSGEMDATWRESGIGIQNTQKRLELLFANRHELKVDTMDYKFKVDLKILL
ncbi:MAG: hypothetical protein AB3N16_13305, partial [Flavobacteriaceae bacterium]